MSGIDARLGLSGVMALRQQILERSQTLGKAAPAHKVAPQAGSPAGFREALETVNKLQQQGDSKASAFVRGETHDIAEVMIARQKAAIAFEATLQTRNRLLGAYRDIMNMPV
jgi:flagellar hook-basal body complex protein FliE